MKHLQRYTALVCMFLVLCMLPAVAGAEPVWMEESELHFTVGVEGKQEVCAWIKPEEAGKVFKLPGFDVNSIPKGLKVETTSLFVGYEDGYQQGYRYTFSGTPLSAGEYNLEYKVKFYGLNPDSDYSLWLKIIIHEKQQVTPSEPPVVDDVVYNAAAYHEQALICGVQEWCNVRAGAGTQHEIVGRANLGQQISLLCWNADESWCYVEFDGMEGWIAKQFILPIK